MSSDGALETQTATFTPVRTVPSSDVWLVPREVSSLVSKTDRLRPTEVSGYDAEVRSMRTEHRPLPPRL